MHKGELKKI